MRLKTRITFSGPQVKHFIPGKEVDLPTLTVGDLTERLSEVEIYLERITGLKVKITTEAV